MLHVWPSFPNLAELGGRLFEDRKILEGIEILSKAFLILRHQNSGFDRELNQFRS